MIVAHFIDVGQGNMVLLQLADGTTMLCDCNVTDENATRVLGYLGTVLPRQGIDIFVNSHREADHMRGAKRVHESFPISTIWDSGVTGVTTDSMEYGEYMALRLRVPRCVPVARRTYYDFGTTRVRIMNSKNDDLPDDPNAQSVVIKVENWYGGHIVNSLMLTGDSDTRTWERSIIPFYGEQVTSTVLMGSHHGADDFVREPNGDLYLQNMRAIRPRVTVVSVGDNSYGHPDPFSLLVYNLFSMGADWVIGGPARLKVLRTDLHGTLRLQLHDNGSWVINWYGPSPRAVPDFISALMRLGDGRGRVLPNFAPSLSDILGQIPAPTQPWAAARLFGPPFLSGLLDIAPGATGRPAPLPFALGPGEPSLADILADLLKRPPGLG